MHVYETLCKKLKQCYLEDSVNYLVKLFQTSIQKGFLFVFSAWELSALRGVSKAVSKAVYVENRFIPHLEHFQNTLKSTKESLTTSL